MVITGAAAFGLALFVVQNSLIVKFDPFLGHLARQFLYQSAGYAATVPQMAMEIHSGLRGIVSNYWMAAGPGLVLAAALLAPVLFMQRPWLDLADRFGLIAVLLLVSALAHHILLARFTAEHWYSALKGVYFVAVMVAVLSHAAWSQALRGRRVVVGVVIAIAAIAPLADRQYRAYADVDHTAYQREAFPIWRHARPDEVVFLISTFPVVPQVVYYAQRNIQRVDSVDAARRWRRESGTSVRKGIVFHRLGSEDFERIEVD